MVHFSPKTILTFIFFFWQLSLSMFVALQNRKIKTCKNPDICHFTAQGHYNPHGKTASQCNRIAEVLQWPPAFCWGSGKMAFRGGKCPETRFQPAFFLTRVANQVWLVFRVDVFRAVFAKPWMALDAVVILLYLICDSKTFFLDVLLVLRIKDR